MTTNTRRWFQIDQDMLLCIDFQEQIPIAQVRTGNKQGLSVFIARVGSISKDFGFDTNDQKGMEKALYKAIKWCQSNIGVPITYVPTWKFVIKCLMFWKYEVIWLDGRPAGIKPKGFNSQQLSDDAEWQSIIRGFNKP